MRMTEIAENEKSQDYYQVDFVIHSLNDLSVFAHKFSSILYPGLFLGLRGDLGSGKTTLVREILKALDCPAHEYVTSPTFVLVQDYPARIPVSHLDLYRLEGEKEFAQMGGFELFLPENIIMVEWVERMESLLPENRTELALQIQADNTRKITLRGYGQLKKLVEKWSGELG